MSEKRTFKTFIKAFSKKEKALIIGMIVAIPIIGFIAINLHNSESKLNNIVIEAVRKAVNDTKTSVGPKFSRLENGDYIYKLKNAAKESAFISDSLKQNLVELESNGNYYVTSEGFKYFDAESHHFYVASYKFMSMEKPHLKWAPINKDGSRSIIAYPYVTYATSIPKIFQYPPMEKYVPKNIKEGVYESYLVLNSAYPKPYFWKSSECNFPGKSTINLPKYEQRIDYLQNVIPNDFVLIVIVLFLLTYIVFFYGSNHSIVSKSLKYTYIFEKAFRLIIVLFLPMYLCITLWNSRGFLMYAIEQYSTEIIFVGVLICFYLLFVKIALNLSNKLFNTVPKSSSSFATGGASSLKGKLKENDNE